MSEQTDKPLHDWVRQSLNTYRPEYNLNDWVSLQRTLRRRRWQRWGIWSCILLLTGFVGYFINLSSTNQPTNKPSISPNQPKIAHHDEPTSSALATKLSVHQRSSLSNNRRSVPIASVSRQADPIWTVGTPATIINASHPLPHPTPLTAQILQRQPVGFSPEEKTIAQQMLTGTFGSDSTSYQVLNRNLRNWSNAVIVCDFTTSMYPYSTQLFAWFKQHAQHPSIKGIVFFTDCDSLGRQTQPGGPAGQMFTTRNENPTQVLPILLAAARNTVRNDDDAENDVEALLYAQKQFPEASHLILLADNISRVKDISLVNKIKKPVHVILCGTTGSDTTLAYQPDYFTIANQTNGSLHTLEDDINPMALSSLTTLRVGTRYFRYLARKQRFKPTTFDHRPRRIFKFIWF